MNDARKLRAAKQMRRDIRRARKRQPRNADDDILIRSIRKALAKHPMSLLGLASYFISVTADSIGNFVDGLAGRPGRETTALLAVFAELLVEHDGLRERCRREVATRGDRLPKWIAGLPNAELHRVVRQQDELGDGEQLLVGVRMVDATELTVGVYLDHNLLSTLTDITLSIRPLDRVLANSRETNDGEGSFDEMVPADLRSMIEYGLRHGILLPRSDDCHLALPLAKWLVAQLPTGGHPYEPRTYDEKTTSELLGGFFASPAGAPFRDLDYRRFLRDLCDTGCGDPSRWSVRRISSILRRPFYDEHIPLEIALDAPALLRAFVSFAHAVRGIRQELTDAAVARMDDMGLGYRRELIEEATRYGDEFVEPPPWLAPDD